MQSNELGPINLAALANLWGKPNKVGQMCVNVCMRRPSGCTRAPSTVLTPVWPRAPGGMGLLAAAGLSGWAHPCEWPLRPTFSTA